MTLWVLELDSRNFSFLVIGKTAGECRRAFCKHWNAWCKETGADPYYWGTPGDKWADVTPTECEVGAVYRDRYKV